MSAYASTARIKNIAASITPEDLEQMAGRVCKAKEAAKAARLAYNTYRPGATQESAEAATQEAVALMNEYGAIKSVQAGLPFRPMSAKAFLR